MSPLSNSSSPQVYARTAGALLIISIIAGAFGEWYVPSLLVVSGDPAATAANFIASDSLVRLGFASYLVEATCDIILAWLLYVLLRPVHRELALLSAFFGLVSTAVFAVAAQLFQFAPSFMVRHPDFLTSFSPDQVNSLAYLSLRYSAYGGGLFMVFYGFASILRGYLIFGSGYLPKTLGVLLILGGIGFVIRNVVLVLAPDYLSDILLPPMIIAMLALGVWLLARGVELSQWKEQTRIAGDI